MPAAIEYVPKSYQERGIALQVNRRGTCMFADPGLGKSSMWLAAFTELRARFEANRALLIAPRLVCKRTWPAEIAKWKPFQHLRHVWIHGDNKLQALQTPADIYLVTPEGIPWLEEQRWNWPDTLYVDESSKWKHTNTNRFKSLRRGLHHYDRRGIATGTPAASGLINLYGQVYLVDMGRAFGPNPGDFKQSFFVPEVTYDKDNKYPKVEWTPRNDALPRISKLLSPFSIRLDVSLLPEMPPLVVNRIDVHMPAPAREKYKRFREELILELASGEVSASDAGVLTQKCRQVANGSVYLDQEIGDDATRPDFEAGDRPVGRIHEAKLDALEDLLDELQGKRALLFYEFKHDLAEIRRRFGNVPNIDSRTSDRRADEILSAWDRGEIPLLALHPKTAGHGLNMQDGGNVAIWYSLTWSLELYQQAVARLWRQGQRLKVLIYHLVTRGTVDETIERTLRRNDADQRALFQALKEDMIRC